MWQQYFTGHGLLQLPLLAMFLFMGAFVAVLIRVLLWGRTPSPLSQLPLQGDSPQPTPGAQP